MLAREIIHIRVSENMGVQLDKVSSSFISSLGHEKEKDDKRDEGNRGEEKKAGIIAEMMGYASGDDLAEGSADSDCGANRALGDVEPACSLG
jgi:hypothetical protein